MYRTGLKKWVTRKLLRKAGPAALEHPGDREARGVGADDRAGLEVRLDAGEQGLLDCEVLLHHLHHPVALGDPGEVVVEVAHLDEVEGGRGVEGRRPELLQIRQAGERELVPEGLLAPFLPGARFRWDHVQHQDRDAGVGHVGGDAASHDARTEDRDLSDEAHRRCSLGAGDAPCRAHPMRLTR
jgi:hypothetical protein